MAKSKQGFRWTPSEEAFVRANRGTMTREEMGAALGRSASAVASWIAKNRVSVRQTIDAEAYLRRNWETMGTQAIASVLRMNQQAVREMADRLGLDPKAGAGASTPSKPKGLRPSQVIWARLNRETDPEAAMICAMDERPDPAAGRTVAR